jgi:hypothetical protein
MLPVPQQELFVYKHYFWHLYDHEAASYPYRWIERCLDRLVAAAFQSHWLKMLYQNFLGMIKSWLGGRGYS